MIRPICYDQRVLRTPSQQATKMDLPVIGDLIDTLKAHQGECVGMAANMIGVLKNIIVVDTGFFIMPMVNPTIVKKEDSYEAVEGCLSLPGQRKTERYHKIVVRYEDAMFQPHVKAFEGRVAQIILHEIDHLHGILI